MKKHFITLFVAVMACIISVGLSSCKKDKAETLEGTTWVGIETDDGIQYTYTMKFEKSRVVFTLKDVDLSDPSDTSEDTFIGQYTYKAPVATITFSSTEFSPSFVVKGVIEKNTLTFMMDGDTVVLRKQ